MITQINQILQKEKHAAGTDKSYEKMYVFHYATTLFILLLVTTEKKRYNMESTAPNGCKFQKPKALGRTIGIRCPILSSMCFQPQGVES